MRIYKPTYTTPMPEGAKTFARKGKRFAKFRDAKGHTAEARLTKAGDKILCETENWHIEFEDNQSIRRKLKAYTNEQATQRLADRIQQVLDGLLTKADKYFAQIPHRLRADLVIFGVLDEKAKQHTTIDGDIADFVNWLRTTKYRHGFNRAGRYIRVVVSRIKNIVKGCKVERWADLNQHDVEIFLGGLSVGPATYNGYVTAIKQFGSWMVENERAEKSPIKKLKPLSVPDKEYRRSLNPKEVARLLEATENAPFRYGMAGHERAAMYLLLVETGIRRGALLNLTVSDFDFEKGQVTISARKVKQRKEVVRYLKRERAIQLKEFFRNRLPGCTLFNFPPSWRSADMVRDDLKETAICGLDGKVILPAIPQCDEQGRKFDLHGFKHSYATALDATDATLAERMDLTGHSRKRSLTLGTYTHTEPSRLRDIVEQLPFYDWPHKKQAIMTGTDRAGLPLACSEDADLRTKTENKGPKTAESVQQTPSGGNNKGGQCSCSPEQKSRKTAPNTQKQGLSDGGGEPLATGLFFDPDLQKVVKAWPILSDEVKRIILKMVAL